MELTSLPVAELCLRGSILLALAAVLAFTLRKRSASSRYLVWFAGLTGLALVPALILALPAWNILPLPNNEPLPQLAPTLTLDLPALPITELDLPAIASTETAEASRSLSWQSIALTTWAIVTAYLLLRLLAGFFAVAAARRRSLPTDPATQALVNSLAGELGITRTILTYREEGRAMPMSCGLWRSAVILPSESSDWEDAKLRSVLLHELAHHKRRDPLLHAGAQLVRAFHWFNPLVWIAWTRLKMERERACDDLALASGLIDPLEYARHFVSVVAGSSTQNQSGLALGEHTQLQERLKAILNNHHIRKPVSKPMNTICLTVTIALALPVALLNAAPPETTTTKEPPPAAEAEQSPKLTSRTVPKYPPRLRKRGVSGKVLLSATINPDGTIGKVNVKESSGHKAMDKAALEAFSKWKFEPATRNGKPIESKTEQPFVFQAEGNDRENHPLIQALKLFQEGNLKKAEAKLKSAIEQGLETPRAHHTLGLIYAQQARWQEAKTQLKAAVASGYRHRNTDLLLGHAYLQLGNLHDAEKHAQLALKRDQASAEVHSLFIHCLLQQNDWPDALKACRSALAIVKDDKLKATYSRLAANASLSMKNYAEAANFLRNSLHFNPDQKETQQLLQKLDQFVEGR